MAKRRKLEAPSAADLTALEEEFRRETSPKGPLSAPIAQVASEAAQAGDLRSAEDRAKAARDEADAASLREAAGAGRLILDVALSDIEPGALIRDRMALDAEDLDELKRSIAAHGLRLPVEIFERQTPGDGPRYGLLSGYRRYLAVEGLAELSSGQRHQTIRAIVRDPESMGGTFVAMVEENEVRSNLSHFERGRIAVLAAQEGAFVNVEAAVDALFATGSRAKRSKIRSFAVIFEELGDMLAFPEAMKERDGLRLAAALRAGGEGALREALALAAPQTPEAEQAVLAEAVEALTMPAHDPARGGRPKRVTVASHTRRTDAGIKIDVARDGDGWTIRLSGARLDAELMDSLTAEIEALLSKG